MKKVIVLKLIAVFLIAFTNVQAQKKDGEKYRKESEEIRKQI